MALDDIVNVQITAQTQTVSQPGFGIPLIVGTNKSWNDLARSYSSLSAVGQDFTPNQPEYIAAQAVFAQDPCPTGVVIGRRQADEATLNILTALPNQVYNVIVNGLTATVNSGTTQQIARFAMSGNFVSNNLINVNLNGIQTFSTKSIINFSADFVSSNSITPTVNGTALTPPVSFTTDQQTTITAVAAKIATATGVLSAVVTGQDQITVEFSTAGSNVVDSVVTTGGASQPTATIFAAGMESVLDFSADFVSGNAITARVNGDDLDPVDFTTDNATTIQALATAIESASGVAVATVTDTNEITVYFTTVGTIESVITAGGASQPVCTISQGGYVYSTSQVATMTMIANILASKTGVASAVIDPADPTNKTLKLTSSAGVINNFSSIIVTLGSSQATATISNDSLAKTIALAMVTAINSLSSPGATASYQSSPDGTILLTSDPSGTPYTLKVSTPNIVQPNACIVQVTSSVVNQNYVVRIDGVSFNYVAQVFDTIETIAATLVSQINSYQPSLNITATDNMDGTFKLASNNGTSTFAIFATAQVMTIIKGINVLPFEPSDTITDTLDAINNLDLDWYAIVLISRETADVLATAAWTETMSFIFGTSSSDANIINQAVGVDTTSIAAQLQNLNYFRTFCMYHQDADATYPEAAWMGVVLPEPPGGETWKFKNLAGVNESNLTDTQSTNALAKNCNTYEFIGGVGITQNGTMASGEFIDITRGIDWLKSQIVANVYSTLVNNPKVPYTDAGITTIQSQVQKALTAGVNQNFLSNDPAPKVTVPLAANVSSVDKANRILRNVTFTATVAGAIHAVNITGTLTV